MRRRVKELLLLAVCMCMLTGCSLYDSIIATDVRADLTGVYETKEQEAAVFVNNIRTETNALIVDGAYYLSLDEVSRSLDKRFYWDGKDDRLLFTDAETIHKESVSDTKMAVIQDEKLYLSLDCLSQYLDLQTAVFEEVPARIFIDTAGSSISAAEISSDTVLRVRGGLKSEITADVKSGEQVILLEEHENWAKVRSETGHIGYMQNKYFADRTESEIPVTKEEPAYTNITHEEPICLVWQDMENRSGNRQFEYLIKDTSGINVISPAWLALEDNQGSYRNLISEDYIKYAHGLGMEVWVLIDDFNDNMSIGKVLGSTEVRQKLVKNLIRDVKSAGADGINVDFEYISDSCGRDFIQFLRELSIECRKKQLVLSVDNPNPTFVRYCYDMREQGRMVDYVILMGYDEHWQGSEAGSVASIGYVEEGILQALEMVPAEKIIGGLPFYARIWTEIPEEYAQKGAEIREDGNSEYERYSLTSSALSMDEIASHIKEAGVEPQWREEFGQNYVEIPLEHGKERIWIEDMESLSEKLKVVAENSLAGAAFWKLGMENDGVWELISQINGSR